MQEFLSNFCIFKQFCQLTSQLIDILLSKIKSFLLAVFTHLLVTNVKSFLTVSFAHIALELLPVAGNLIFALRVKLYRFLGNLLLVHNHTVRLNFFFL